MKIKIDREVADKIFKKELIELIGVTADSIINLLNEKKLKQYQIRDLTYDRDILKALLAVYKYTNIDGDQFDEIYKECLW